ncbi:hypothetical protein GVN21_17590 [Caulobacter sp. SLTY]|uniref:hypothetical protein n=1 Tax=Caulobacter sp. SLTY TaxID=2683262 RepID=UPI001411BB1A|nr:hypothetical protein [Caulobacter sp. SLTY]NBB17181.1 hypothetical protein [Caulobacter sp. SLTY]
MKKVLLTVAATAALVAAMPATVSAQPRGDRDYRGGYDQRRDYDNRGAYQRGRWNQGTRSNWRLARQIDQKQAYIDQRIETLVRRGRLDIGEARGMQRTLNSIERVEGAYKRDRDLTRQEYQHLNRMLTEIERDIERRART